MSFTFVVGPYFLKSNLTLVKSNSPLENALLGCHSKGSQVVRAVGTDPGLYMPAARFRGLGTRLRI